MNDLWDFSLYESLARLAETQQRILDSVKPSLELQQRILDSVKPAIDFQQRMDEIFEPVARSAESISSMLAENTMAFNDMQQKLASITASSLAFHVDDSLLHLASLDVPSGLSESMRRVLESTSTWFSEQSWPTLDWLQSFDFSPLTETLQQLAVDERVLLQFDKINRVYQQALYESKWFPYPGWLVNRTLLREISDIISTSRGPSKRREQRIDKAVLTYYTDKVIKRIKQTWNNSDLDYVTRKILCQAINAFLRKEYALTISCLATKWDGLIYMKAHNVSASQRQRRRPSIIREELVGLIDYNGFELIPSDYYNQFITADCNSVDEIVDGVPNRNGEAHGWYKRYPNRKAALNAILLTDFLIMLEPIASQHNPDQAV